VALPHPVPGLVIRYSYLWRAEHLKGREEGVKDRPCAIVLVTEEREGDLIVTVLPVTHSPPADSASAMEIPAETKRRLGLDSERSWIVMNEANQFVWPGPDLRPAVSGAPESVAYGLLPQLFFEKLRDRLVAILKARQSDIVRRSD
jgi:hypothetical protein